MAAKWRCSECETMNTEDKCIVCGCSKPKTINNTNRTNTVQEQLKISYFNQESLKSVQNSNQYKFDNQQDSINSIKTYTPSRKKKNKKIPIIVLSCITVILVVSVSLGIIKNYVDITDNRDETLPNLTTISTTALQLDVTSIAAETEQPAGTVKIGSEFYDINMLGTLDLTGKGLKNEDIENLKYMTKVSEIILSDNNLTNLSALSELKQLEKLTFHNNNVKDLSFLTNMKRLIVLGAGNNGISDISIFFEVSGLKEIWIFDNNISDISPLKSCKYLEYLDVSNNQISDLTYLAECKLIILKADNNRLNGNYGALTGLTILGELHLEGNEYDDDPDGFYEFCYELCSNGNGFTYWI